LANWLQKLQSRKFLLAIGAIIGVWLGPDTSGTVQTIATAIIAGLYAVGEGIADTKTKE
jgi:hypothetical protein